jgi:HAD superfamily hydrolase (TIGR01509 family)
LSVPRRFLLWDHDGVLVDTEPLYFEVTRDALARFGVELSQPSYLAYLERGQSCWDLVRERGVSEEQVRAGRLGRDAEYQRLLRERPIEIAGVVEVLGALARTHRMAIVTSARRHDFELIHAERQIARHFEFVVTIDDVEHGKPHPASYLRGLARFGAEPADVLAVEDSAQGLAAARAAGLDCVVIRNAFMHAQDFRGALRVLDSVRELPALLAAASGGVPSKLDPATT